MRMACLAKDLALTEQLVDLLASPGFGRLGQAASAVDTLPPLAVMASQLHCLRTKFKMVSGDPGGAQIEIQRAIAPVDVASADGIA